MAKTTSRSADADDTTAVQGASTADASGADTPTPARTRRTKADPATDAADAPRPRRAPARKKAADAEAPAADGPAEGPAEDAPKPRRTRAKTTDAPDAVPSEDAPKPRRTRKKADADAPAEAAPAEAARAEATPAEDAPKPRRTRAKAADATDAPAEDAPNPRRTRKKADADAPADEAPSADAPAEDAPAPRRRTRTVRAEPVASSDNLPDEVVREDTPRDDARRDEPRRDEPRRDDRPRGQQQGGPQNQGGQRYDDGYEGGGRRKRKRNKNRGQNGGNPNPGGGQQNQGGQHGGNQAYGGQNGGGQQNSAPAEPFEGILELIGDKKFGFVRQFTTSLVKGDNDPFMPPPLLQKYRLRDGVTVKGMVKPGRKGAWQVVELTEVMGGAPEAWAETPDFDDGLVVYPDEKLKLVASKDDISMRVVDLVAPIGKGQRGLIVAPPRAGKTILIKQIAAGLSQNHPDVKLVALLIDERPEEVTDFRRNTNATVFASSNDYGEDNHIRVATIAFEYARRLVEQGEDVVILLDSLTRLGRTFNMFGSNLSGRTMSGGIDARALLIPRKIFGSARNIENGGSLTIVATALIETGSRMDEVIFEEFKGTGNSEIVLDRELAEQRIYPAINVRKSGTRNEDRLVDPDLLRQRHMLLRALNSRHPVEAMQALAKQLQLSGSNEELLQALVPE